MNDVSNTKQSHFGIDFEIKRSHRIFSLFAKELQISSSKSKTKSFQSILLKKLKPVDQISFFKDEATLHCQVSKSK